MTQHFFDRLWPNRPDAYLATWLKQSNRIRFFHTSEIDRADQYLVSAAEREDAYFGVGLFDTVPSRGRGTGDEVCYLPGLHMDFDIAPLESNVHSQQALPKSINDVMSFIARHFPKRPTVLVNSGNGLHVYWTSQTILDVRKGSGQYLTREVLRQFQERIIELAREHHGWRFDNTSDPARVLRWPGTLNHKTNPPKPVEVIHAGE